MEKFVADLRRREFLSDSAKMGVALGAVATFGNSMLLANSADSSNSNAKGANPAKDLSTDLSKIPTFTLNNGVIMPVAGFGTLKLGDTKATQKAVEDALEAGYRLFDTAQSYANEEAVGYAFKATGVKRDELFITCKLFRPYANEKLA